MEILLGLSFSPIHKMLFAIQKNELSSINLYFCNVMNGINYLLNVQFNKVLKER